MRSDTTTPIGEPLAEWLDECSGELYAIYENGVFAELGQPIRRPLYLRDRNPLELELICAWCCAKLEWACWGGGDWAWHLACPNEKCPAFWNPIIEEEDFKA